MKHHVLIVAPGEAMPGEVGTGTYVKEAFEELGWTAELYDYRVRAAVLTQMGMNQELLAKVRADILDIGFVLVLKGELLKDLTYSIISSLRTIALWDFDAWRAKDQDLVDRAAQCDHFFTICKGLVDWYKEKGVNVHWLSEACSPKYHRPYPLPDNATLYDVGFVGTVEGVPGRAEALKNLCKTDLKIGLWGSYPGYGLGKIYQGRALGDVGQNIIITECKILLGMDRTPEIEGSWSARLYRTLAAGGCYLTNHTFGIENYFRHGEHLYTYSDVDDMIVQAQELTNDQMVLAEDGRRKVAEAGRRLCLSEHSFHVRVKQLLNYLGES